MAKKKVAYVVSSPLEVKGIYYDWPTVQKAIAGKKNIIQQGFYSIEEAETFYNQLSKIPESSDRSIPEKKREPIIKVYSTSNSKFDLANSWDKHIEEVEAWVDGSYNPSNSLSGSGVCFIYEDERILEIAFSEFAKNGDRNISGEINATLKAIEEAFYRGVKHLTIYHDLQHLGSWYRGEYKTNNINAKLFVQKAKLLSKKSGMEIEFKKVKAHSKLELNDRVDFLAKVGCGVIK